MLKPINEFNKQVHFYIRTILVCYTSFSQWQYLHTVLKITPPPDIQKLGRLGCSRYMYFLNDIGSARFTSFPFVNYSFAIFCTKYAKYIKGAYQRKNAGQTPLSQQHITTVNKAARVFIKVCSIVFHVCFSKLSKLFFMLANVGSPHMNQKELNEISLSHPFEYNANL